MVMVRGAGVGITFRQRPAGGYTVVTVSSGGPSDHRGVVPGDLLLLVDGREVTSSSLAWRSCRLFDLRPHFQKTCCRAELDLTRARGIPLSTSASLLLLGAPPCL